MTREVEQGRVDVRVVTVGPGDGAAKLVRNQHFGHAAEELEAADDRADEVVALLRAGCLREGVVARAEHHDEELDLDHFSGFRIDHFGALARVVDERFLAGAVCLPHHEIEPGAPSVIALAKLRVLIGRLLARDPFGGLDVLGPQKLQRHAGAAQLVVDPIEVDRSARQRRAVLRLREEPRLELGVGHGLRIGPRDRAGACPLEVVAHRPRADPARLRDLAVGAATFELQPKDFTNLTHRVSLRHAQRVARPCARRQGEGRALVLRDRVSPKSAIGSAETRDRVPRNP
jgi:hypothetical protein